MSLSICDIAKNISWDENGKIYITQKDLKYELLVDYLNAGSVEHLEQDIEKLKAFQSIQNTNNKLLIEDFIMDECEGFTEYPDGIFAHIAGAHDFSPSIHFNIKDDSISLNHPNLPSIGRFIIPLETLINLLIQMKKIKDCLR